MNFLVVVTTPSIYQYAPSQAIYETLCFVSSETPIFVLSDISSQKLSLWHSFKPSQGTI